uniref:Uncharacterized protein n=1 Tax=Globodera rostochiensis TaxID=31243 RepID=A0A914HVF6_GLORO
MLGIQLLFRCPHSAKPQSFESQITKVLSPCVHNDIKSQHQKMPSVHSRLSHIVPRAVLSPLSSLRGVTLSSKSSTNSLEDILTDAKVSRNGRSKRTEHKMEQKNQQKFGLSAFLQSNVTCATAIPPSESAKNIVPETQRPPNGGTTARSNALGGDQQRVRRLFDVGSVSTADEDDWTTPTTNSFSTPLPNAQISINSSETKRSRWFDSGEAKNSVMCGLSLFYSMLVTIFALVLELSHLMVTNNNRRNLGFNDMLFGIYMYGCSIVFLLYCYFALLLNPRWKRKIKKLLRKNAELSLNIVGQGNVEQLQEMRKVSHDGPSAGSLFLRLGCVVFGLIGTVYYAFNVFLCASDDTCSHYVIVLDIMAIAFVFAQMHFVFCNWKLAISGYQVVCRFGTAHLIATNLWTWIRYILIEQSLMGDEIRQVFARHTAAFPGMAPEATNAEQFQPLKLVMDSDEFENANFNISIGGTGLLFGAGLTVKRSVQHKCHGAECVLASFNEVMYTSIVEYSLIGAAVMFIVWKNIGQHQKQTLLNDKTTNKCYVRRKHRIRMDCSKSTTGLFFGLAFLAGTFTSMSIFSGYTIMGQNRQAMMVFGLTDIIHYIITTFGCGLALWRMRLLRYHTQQHTKTTSTVIHPELIETVLGTDHQHNQQIANLYINNKHWVESGSDQTAITFVDSINSTENGNVGTCSTSAAGNEVGSTNQKSQELLDMILLAFGMTGEMIYSVAGLLGLTGSARTEESNWEQIILILLTVHVTRILQVGLQSCLIYIAGKLRIGNDPVLREQQPGKQAITFLLLANISMFLMNLLEAEKAGVSDTVANFYGKRNWVFLVRSFSPLTIFYRFHSSVCLAEIWKSTYSRKD